MAELGTAGLAIERVPLSSIHEDPSNARLHSPRNLDAIRGSLQRFGQVEPLVVNKENGVIIGGNGRVEAMKQLGWDECDIVRVKVGGVEAAALSIALNRTGELAEWDEPALGRILDSLATEDMLGSVGFEQREVDAILDTLIDESTLVEDAVPEAPTRAPVSRCGDLWQLGEHRLLCGDSTHLTDVQRLLGKEQAAIVVTDPPYLVDYDGKRPNDTGKDWSSVYDEAAIKDADGFFRSVFENVLEVLGPKAPIYCWHAHKRQGLLAGLWDELGIVNHQQIIWSKPTPVFGRVYWHFQHEPCMMGWRKGSQPEHDGDHTHSSVWTVSYDGDKALAQGDHPTQKPVELFARPILRHTTRGDVCFEPFSGSGSQIMAAEQLDRRCFAIEIEPTFVDVAITRWERVTGQQAVLAETGQSFEDVLAQRGAE